jgi:hypothetical protein
MVVDNETAQDAATSADVTIVVQGWFIDQTTLWLQKIGQKMTVYSPMLFPSDSMDLYLRGVTSRQNDAAGTESELSLCLPTGLGGDAPANAQETQGPLASGPTPATPTQPN